jgi:hypothetical protein
MKCRYEGDKSINIGLPRLNLRNNIVATGEMHGSSNQNHWKQQGRGFTQTIIGPGWFRWTDNGKYDD